MAYAIKTPDGQQIYQVVLEPLPSGVDPNRVWPVNTDIPSGTTRVGWQLLSGVCEPFLRVDDPKPPYDPTIETLVVSGVLREATQERQIWIAQPLPVATSRVTNFSFRIALIKGGYDPDLVESDFANITDDEGRKVAITTWKYAMYFDRSWTRLNRIRALFGLTELAMDKLFVVAGKLDGRFF